MGDYRQGFIDGYKECEEIFKEMIEGCDEEPCCHGIQKKELLSKLNSKKEKQDER